MKDKRSTQKDDKEQSRLFIEKARELGADEKLTAAVGTRPPCWEFG
jgi:hypothetical protein